MLFEKQYYCIVSGLPDIKLEDKKLVGSSFDYLIQWKNDLTTQDYQLLCSLFLPIDHQHIVSLLFDKELDFSQKGLYSKDQLSVLIDSKKLDVIHDDMHIPDYILVTINEFFLSEEHVLEKQVVEEKLWLGYLNYIRLLNNELLITYFDYIMLFNNVLVAIELRNTTGFHKDYFIGDKEILFSLRKSRLRDFGISREFSDIEVLLQIFDVSDFIEREKRIDILKWNNIEGLSNFNYFSVEKLIAFILKNMMLERWIALSQRNYEDSLMKGLKQCMA